jgi:hypothetical protein
MNGPLLHILSQLKERSYSYDKHRSQQIIDKNSTLSNHRAIINDLKSGLVCKYDASDLNKIFVANTIIPCRFEFSSFFIMLNEKSRMVLPYRLF